LQAFDDVEHGLRPFRFLDGHGAFGADALDGVGDHQPMV
jgi:hypothetical protein